MADEERWNAAWNKLAVLLPLILTAAIYLSSAANRAVIDYDEGYYSQVALQMVERGDWVTPYANGVRFLEKPPLMYWATAASFKIFGISEFALRLPTALGVIALVWIVTLMARRASGPRTAMIAGLCTACCVGTFLFTRESLHDIWLVLFVTLALCAFLDWYLDPRHSRGRALLYYAALAGAVMTKSLIGIAFPVGIVIVFFLLARERPGWRTLHVFSGSTLFLLLTVPWHWIVAVRNEGFLRSFFVNEQFLRFLGRHDPPILWSVPLLTFWALILLWFFPWTAFLPAAIAAARRPDNVEERALSRLVLAWLIVVLGFYTVSARLEHYAFPILPALSLLVGLGLGRRGEPGSAKWGFRSLGVLGAAVLVAGMGALLWFAAAGHRFSYDPVRGGMVYETDFSIMAEMPAAMRQALLRPAVATCLCLAIGFLAAWWLEARRRRMHAVISIAVAMAVVCGMVQWSLVICEDMISSKKFALAVGHEARPGDHLVVVGDFESANSISFYQPLRVEVFDGVAYSLIPGMKFPDAPRTVLDGKEFESLWRGGERVFALVSRSRLGELKLEGTEVLQVMDRVLVRNR